MRSICKVEINLIKIDNIDKLNLIYFESKLI